ADQQPHTPPAKLGRDSRRRRWLLVLIAVAVLIAAVGIVNRLTAHARLKTLTAAEAVPTVAVMTPNPGGASGELILPGDVQALRDAPIYARTTGYVKVRHVDIGEQVKAGQVLAELDTPEIDQQLRQA